tara:strand:+ start:739 stop:1158 length:420 start_codon:yes stop_codon:yes gene_type:complete
MKKKIVIVSGYFNPLHKGHIEYFHNAKKLGDKLFIIINNDFQRKLKGSKKFMNENERLLIINELKITDKVFLAIDKDKSVVKTIEYIHSIYSDTNKIYFVNGGDQNNKNIPECEVCERLKIKLIDGLGDKIQSSSWLLN